MIRTTSAIEIAAVPPSPIPVWGSSSSAPAFCPCCSLSSWVVITEDVTLSDGITVIEVAVTGAGVRVGEMVTVGNPAAFVGVELAGKVGVSDGIEVAAGMVWVLMGVNVMVGAGVFVGCGILVTVGVHLLPPQANAPEPGSQANNIGNPAEIIIPKITNLFICPSYIFAVYRAKSSLHFRELFSTLFANFAFYRPCHSASLTSAGLPTPSTIVFSFTCSSSQVTSTRYARSILAAILTRSKSVSMQSYIAAVGLRSTSVIRQPASAWKSPTCSLYPFKIRRLIVRSPPA